MVLNMRAAVLQTQGLSRPYVETRPLHVNEVVLDSPGPGEILIKMRAAGLCHSDLSALEGNRVRSLPAVAGHEGSGVVQEVGEGVDKIHVGDHVVVLFVSSCGRCRYCLNGRRTLCESSWEARKNGVLPNGERRLHMQDGTPLNHWSGASTFAEYAVVHESSVVVIDKDIPLTTAALFGCSVVTGVGAVLNTAKVRAGDSVLVAGLGGVGLSAVMAAALAGANPVIAIDVVEEKLELARSLGATTSLNARDPETVDAVIELTQGGVDFAFEMSGVESSIANAYAMTARGGAVVMASLPHPEKTFSIPLASHVADEKRFIGSYMGSAWAARDIPKYIDLYRNGLLPVDRLLSASTPLDEINHGFDRLARGEAVRDIVVFD